MLSSIYYGIFLATLLGLGAVLLIADGIEGAAAAGGRAARGRCAAGGGVSAAYAVPYLRVHESGRRPRRQMKWPRSARGRRVISIATPDNWLYGGRQAARNGPERRLFPGAIPGRPGDRRLAPAAAVAARHRLSAAAGRPRSRPRSGSAGTVYSFLYEHVSVYRGLRASARLGIFVLMFLAVLAAYGYRRSPRDAARRSARPSWARLRSASLCRISHDARTRAVSRTAAPPVYRILAHCRAASSRSFRYPLRRAARATRRIRVHVDLPLVPAGQRLQRRLSRRHISPGSTSCRNFPDPRIDCPAIAEGQTFVTSSSTNGCACETDTCSFECAARRRRCSSMASWPGLWSELGAGI